MAVAALLWSSGASFAQQIKPADVQASCMKDAMFVFDASGSMGTTDFTVKEPHIARVKRALRQVMPEIPASRRMGLIVYGQGAYNKCDSIELKLKPQTNAGPAIMDEVEKVTPAGRTPLTQSVQNAAEVLNYTVNPGVVVLLTDGEETCGGKTCDVARALKKASADLTIHVIGYRNKEAGGLGATFGARCLADETGGHYISVETTEQLVDALRKTLTCPLFTETGRPHPQGVAIQSHAPRVFR
ncbi:MAG: vWA domain-containing protein [Hyphomicrobium sp.]